MMKSDMEVANEPGKYQDTGSPFTGNSNTEVEPRRVDTVFTLRSTTSMMPNKVSYRPHTALTVHRYTPYVANSLAFK